MTAPAPATADVLDRYRVAMRAELGDLLDEIRPAPDPSQLTLDGAPATPKRPALAERLRLWDLAIKLGRELATGEDLEPELVEPGSPTPLAGRRAPRLTPAMRRQLGG